MCMCRVQKRIDLSFKHCLYSLLSFFFLQENGIKSITSGFTGDF